MELLSTNLYDHTIAECTVNKPRLQTCMTYTIAEFTVNKLLMMDSRTVRNM
jgi:hypothetical protein